MSAFFHKLARIDKDTKYGVYGWIRRAEKELRLSHVPIMIYNICVILF